MARKENAVPQAANKPQAQIDAEEKIARKNPASFERQFERSEDIFSDADLDAELKKIEMQKQIKEKSASSKFAGPSLDGEPKKLTRREKNKLAIEKKRKEAAEKRQERVKARNEKSADKKRIADANKLIREAKAQERKTQRAKKKAADDKARDLAAAERRRPARRRKQDRDSRVQKVVEDALDTLDF